MGSSFSKNRLSSSSYNHNHNHNHPEMQTERVEELNLFGRPTYTKNQAINQKNLESFAEKISMLDTLQSCEKTVYRLVPNLPSGQNNNTMINSVESAGSASASPTPNPHAKYDSFN